VIQNPTGGNASTEASSAIRQAQTNK